LAFPERLLALIKDIVFINGADNYYRTFYVQLTALAKPLPLTYTTT
jgi:hypothetical protein